MINREINTKNAITRPGATSLDSILGHEYPILDHGMVRVVDYMGDDAAIVQAARVSYGAGTEHVQSDEALIRYLMRHWHSTPFEMCLSGDTLIPHFAPSGVTVKHYRMADLAQAFLDGGKENSWVKLLRIRTANPITKIVTGTKIKRAWKTGTKGVYLVKTEAPFNRSIKLTSNHPILTPDGYKSIDNGIQVGSEIMLNGIPATHKNVVDEIIRRRQDGASVADVCAAMGVKSGIVNKYAPGRAKRVNGYFKSPPETHVDPRAVCRRLYPDPLGICEANGCDDLASDRHHIDENPYNQERENIAFLCSKHHRHAHQMGTLEQVFSAKIMSIEYIGDEDVYDLEVEDENHNFVAEGIVVHNCEIKLHVKLPVFVARQWIRHRTANVNEYSARYSILDGDFYIPEADKLALQSTTNNQGRGQLLDAERAADLRQYLRNSCDERYDIYRSHTDPNGEWNLARELARMDLPMNIYTQWYWKTDLHNLFHFLRLRADPHAQYEIRVYAELIHQLVKEWVPMATRAFEDYRMNAVNFSAMEMEMLRQYLSDIQDFGDGMNPPLLAAMKPTASMSVRERNEFLKKIGTK